MPAPFALAGGAGACAAARPQRRATSSQPAQVHKPEAHGHAGPADPRAGLLGDASARLGRSDGRQKLAGKPADSENTRLSPNSPTRAATGRPSPPRPCHADLNADGRHQAHRSRSSRVYADSQFPEIAAFGVSTSSAPLKKNCRESHGMCHGSHDRRSLPGGERAHPISSPRPTASVARNTRVALSTLGASPPNQWQRNRNYNAVLCNVMGC